jgi:hypothetical protein
MAYYLDLFSPATYEAFSKSDRSVSGFQIRHKHLAQRVKPGDEFLCYLTKLSRWFGILQVLEGPYVDDKPIFYPAADPFVVRFRVAARVWLPVDQAVPIKEAELWDHLSFTKGYDVGTSAWAQKVKGSLTTLSEADAALIVSALTRQATNGKIFPFDQKAYQGLITHLVATTSKPVSVTVPTPTAEEKQPAAPVEAKEVRESIQIQALLAEIGAKMGMKIWIPKADRTAVLAEWKGTHPELLDTLPLNYDDVTLKTIHQIDVLWLKGRSIQRAFEVEHTTSIYSGLLRMADLMALQPNMDIRLHIVAPESRRDKVFEEILRPVFSLLENHPLSERCTLLVYDSVRELAHTPKLEYMSEKVIEQYEESAAELDE